MDLCDRSLQQGYVSRRATHVLGGTIHEVGQERGGRKECGLAQARVLVGRRGVDGTNGKLVIVLASEV